MGLFVISRLLRTAFVVWVVSVVAFLLMRLSGDPVNVFLPEDAPEEQRVALRHQLGLDQPLPVQYAIFISDAVRGNFGRSIRYGTPALSLIVERLPATFVLTASGLFLATLVGIPLGITAATNRAGWLDAPLISVGLVLQATPGFWLGLMLVLLFAVQLRWLPTSGFGTPNHLILPAITLAASFLAQIALLVRAGMLEVLSEMYIRTARAKGLPEMAVIVRHALKNTLIPVVTLIGLTFGQLMGGVVILEVVFSWPGVGQLAVQSVYSRDFPVVQAAVVLLAVLIVMVNLAVDLIYGLLDPRIRVTA